MLVRKRKRLCIKKKFQMYVYSGHALSYTKLVHRHATQTDFIKCLKMEFWSFVTTLTVTCVTKIMFLSNTEDSFKEYKNKTVLVKL